MEAKEATISKILEAGKNNTSALQPPALSFQLEGLLVKKKKEAQLVRREYVQSMQFFLKDNIEL